MCLLRISLSRSAFLGLFMQSKLPVEMLALLDRMLLKRAYLFIITAGRVFNYRRGAIFAFHNRTGKLMIESDNFRPYIL